MALLGRVFGKRKDGGPKTPAPEPKLSDLRMPAIWLARCAPTRSLSRLGGLPSLPETIAWPRQTVSNTPLHFLAQIDLTTLPPTPLDARIDNARLPRTGLLLFFADIEEEMLWEEHEQNGDPVSTRVIFVDKAGPERAAPDDLPDIGHAFGEMAGGYSNDIKVFPAKPVASHTIDTFAGVERYFQGKGSERADDLTMASIERATGQAIPVFDQHLPRTELYEHPAAYLEHRDTQGQVMRRTICLTRHQMLGAATNVQGTAEGARAADHILLCQLDSDFGVHRSFMFCDMGMVQYWIKRDDLAAGRFDRAWGTTEGG